MSGRRFWVADLHLGHAKVAELRGFVAHNVFDTQAVFRHDETILDQLRRLDKDDEVWVLGDISSGKPEHEQKALEALSFMPPRLHLIAGNHDSVSSTHRQGYKQQRRWLEVFESVQQFGRVRLAGKDVLMSHYPYARSGDGPERSTYRYAEYRLPAEGFPLIHGHTHQSEPHMPNRHRVSYLHPEQQLDRQQFCVSWDAHRRLVTEHDLNVWLKPETYSPKRV